MRQRSIHISCWLWIGLLLTAFETVAYPAEPSPAANFEATVVGTNTFAHSGPGIGYYPTMLLKPGDTVTVTGQREGDWVKILPPTGSFSWIPADAIQEQDDGTAKVIKDAVKVRVGSSLSDAHFVYQVELKQGDKVQILDQAYLPDKDQVQQWFKIVPPANEVRYVAAARLKFPGSTPEKLISDFDQLKAEPTPTDPAKANPAMPIPQTAPAKPLNASIIPPAKIRYQTEERIVQNQTGKPVTIEVKDNPELPFEERLGMVELQLGRMQTLAPEAWDLPSFKAILEQLYAQANGDQAKQSVLAAFERLRRLETLKGRYERATRQRELALQNDAELRNQQLRWQQMVASLRPRFTAEGILERAGVAHEDVQWKLTDATGIASHLVIFPAGLEVEKYAGTRVGLLGSIEQRDAIRIPILRVEQLVPLGGPTTAASR